MNSVRPEKNVVAQRLVICAGGFLCCLVSACSPDYIYLRPGTPEMDLRQDYVECAGRNPESTTTCMETKGYRVLVIPTE